jgi:hypothetical protein
MGKESAAELMAEVEQRLAHLAASLPDSVSVVALGVRSKAPYKVLSIREALIWRTEELARGAHQMLKQGDFASAIILTRAVIESTAVMARLAQEVLGRGKATDAQLDETLMKLLMAWKMPGEGELPAPINILTLVDQLDKRIGGGVRRAYDFLSEFAHPNWNGVRGLFSKTDREAHVTYFGRVHDGDERLTGHVLSPLAASLGIFELDYEALSEVMPTWLAELGRLAPEE